MGQGLDGSLVLSNLLGQSGDGLIAGGLVGSVLLVSNLLVGVNFGKNLIDQESDFLNWALDGNVQGDSGQHGRSELVLVHLGQDGLGVEDGASLVVLTNSNGSQQSDEYEGL